MTLLKNVVATVLTGLGLRSKDHHTKYKYYRFAVIVMGLAREYSNFLTFFAALNEVIYYNHALVLILDVIE